MSFARRVVVAAVLLLGAPPARAQGVDPERAAELGAQLEALAPRVATDPAAACNAGWIRFQLGALDDAARDLDAAIVRLGTPRAASDRRVLGACLYNRGRVAEARGRIAEARGLYERSIAVRPSTAVSARLAALPAAPPIVASPPPQPWSSEGGAATSPLPAELSAIGATMDCEARAQCSVEVVQHLAGTGAITEAWIVWARQEMVPADWGSFFVVIRDGAGLRVSEAVAMVDSPGEGYEHITVAGELRTDTEGTYVAVRTEIDHVDHEVGEYHQLRRALAIVWPEPTGVRAASLELANSETDAEGNTSSYALTAVLGDDAYVTVRRASGRIPREARGAVGRRRTREIAAR